MMASEKPKVSRSLIPIPTKSSNSLKKLPQITSHDKCKTNSSKFISITTSTKREVTRNVSLSRLPTNSSISAKSCPSIVKSISQDNSSKQNTLRDDSASLSITSKVNSSVKEFAKNSNNETHKSCQQIKNNYNKANTHIYNKFSPYYEQQLLDDYSNDSIYQSNKMISSSFNTSKRSQSSELDLSMSSVESCLSREKQEIPSSILYRTQSVPERMVNTVYANDDNWMLMEKSMISQLKNKLELNNDNNEESDEKDSLEKSDNDININVSPNVENKLLRIVIRHLREQLKQSKYSIEKLSQQLSSNKQVADAFEKSLSAMTIRAQQLTQQLDAKENQIDNLLIDIKDKKLEVEDLNNKITSFESELRKHRKSISINLNSDNSYRNNSSLSTLSNLETNDETENKKLRSKWFHGSTLGLAFKRKKKSHSNLSSKDEIESVVELKNMLREKEMMITDLRLGSLATNHRLEQLEDALKNSEEETNHLKRKRDFLERMMKLKIID